MAKRKAASSRRKTAVKRASSSTAARTRPARKSASRAGASKRRARKSAARKGAVRKTGARKVAIRKSPAPRKTARSAKTGRSAPRKAAHAAPKKAALRQTSAKKKATIRKQVARPAGRQSPAPAPKSRARALVATRAANLQKAAKPTRPPRRIATPAVARKAPSLSRERRTVTDEDFVPSPPSTLDLDRSASSARTGRRELRERFDQHTETGPALTGGDVDGDWESAYTVGDEAPGGDNPTPDQDIVDDIGRAVGVQYEDNEELKGDEKIAKRDRNRWELDPASSEDYDDR